MASDLRIGDVSEVATEAGFPDWAYLLIGHGECRYVRAGLLSAEAALGRQIDAMAAEIARLTERAEAAERERDAARLDGITEAAEALDH